MTKNTTSFSKDNQPATRGEGEPIIKSNKRRKYITDALNVALNRRDDSFIGEDGKPLKKLQILANKMVDRAIEGDNVATAQVVDRIEGKAAQAIDMTVKGQLSIFEILKADDES